MKGEMPSDFDAKANEFIAKLQANPAKIASRKASQNAIEAFGPLLPEFLGGSANLAPSNLTLWSGSKPINEDAAGNYIHYGVREFGMTAIANGIALHGGFLPYTSTFLMFVEYARNAVRMAALMKQRQVMVYTHDSNRSGRRRPDSPAGRAGGFPARDPEHVHLASVSTRLNPRLRGNMAWSVRTARPR